MLARPVAVSSTCNWPPSATNGTHNDTGLGYQSGCNHSHRVYPTPSGRRSSTFRWKRSLSIQSVSAGPARELSSTERKARLQYFPSPRTAFRSDHVDRKPTNERYLYRRIQISDVYSMKTACDLHVKGDIRIVHGEYFPAPVFKRSTELTI